MNIKNNSMNSKYTVFLIILYLLSICYLPIILATDETRDSLLEPVLRSIASNDIDAIKKWLNEGHDVNSKYYGMPILVSAIGDKCNFEVFKLLVQSGADLNTPDLLLGAYPVHHASQHKDTRCLKYIIQNGGDISKLDLNGESAYFYASTFHSQNAVEMLWQNGLSPFIKNKRGVDAIHYSILLESDYIFKQVLSSHIDKMYEKEIPRIKDK